MDRLKSRSLRTTPLFLPLLLLLMTCSQGIGQTQPSQVTKAAQEILRCATMTAFEKNMEDPAFRAHYEKGIRDYEQSLQLRTGQTSRNTTLTGPVTIPVVVHIVLPNPYQVTDADVDYFLNRLNDDFAGINADSTNASPFYPVRGHSLLRFTRARRDPAGNYTGGVERRVGSVYINGVTYQPIKHTSAGGLDPWDVTQYYNLWVGVGDPALGLLGIAPAIGPGNQTETTTSTVGIDGVCVDYTAFANSCFSIPAFNLARTSVHEIGHNFGLYHTFQGGCAAVNDFGQLTTPSCQLPQTLLGPADDTPAQSGSTSGCLAGAVAGGCTTPAGAPINKMYQNFMDYTDDRCYSMFTNGQVERMHWVLENCRPGYLTTQGHIPPSNVPALDVAPTSIVSPGGFDFNAATCTSITYANIACPGTITPRVRVTNRGTTTITLVRVAMSLNNGTPVQVTVPVNIPTNYSTVVTFGNVTVNAGANQVLRFWTSLPNGSTDQVPANDTITVNLTVGVGRNLPLVEDFSSPTFPPPGWSLVRMAGTDSSAVWKRSNATNGGAPGSALANFYNITAGNTIDLRTPLLSTTDADTMILSFDVAHRQYNAVQDTLGIWVSGDCGGTFTRVFQQWSSQLTTSAPGTTALTNPTGSDWRNITLKFPKTGVFTNSDIIIAFRGSSRYGNNVFLDNINISKITVFRRDLIPVAVTEPFTTICDGNNVRPAVRVKNQGIDTIRSFTLNYTVNGSLQTPVNFTGTLLRDSSVVVQLNASTLQPGIYVLRAWTSNPNGLPDQLPANDTIQYQFEVIATAAAPLVETFENTTFPPPGWSVTQQPADAITWTRTNQAGRSSSGSAYINNFNYAANDRVDDLVTPVLTYTGADSVFIKFDVAASTYSFPGSTAIPLDTLEVLVTTDCGRSFTTIYKKYGSDLQTIGDPNYPNTDEFFPTQQNQWRTDSVNVTRLLGSANKVRFAFRNTTNFENNIFLDNINFTPKVLPARLKQNGFMITPNPFNNQFAIQHYLPPTDLRGYGIYNSVGQLVTSQSFGEGRADSYIEVNMGRMPSGVYTIKLMYTGRTITQKLVKIN
ncbi:T9SS-dependent choice-of-anchor J family protein [Segetibacter sp. 3557_3]|uniref:T9SS-dependent choice-of-anchor J family protein n=1 Tax=Segetibacter sp. 3557_3 TaxID=2547429 RepID=UPI00140555F4|nr:choice-of-anchor J domain-containing protein [Segetibacter sp. 3557_3]